MFVKWHPAETTDPASRANTRIQYLYRDASNYKAHNEMTFPGRFTDAQIDTIMDSLADGENFVPEKVGMTEIRPGEITSDDGPFFELCREGFIPTDEPCDTDITPDQLTAAFQSCKNHWLDGIDMSIYMDNGDKRDD